MKIQLSGIVNDSIVDGPGIRLTIFTQGCPHHCQGCHNPDTHPLEGGTPWDTDDIVHLMKENPLLDGITFSGGEPFLQPDAIAFLAKTAKELGLSVWSYSGYSLEQIQEDAQKAVVLPYLDVLVDGPFILAQRSLELLFKGSKNQRVIDIPKTLATKEIVLFQQKLD